jgi:hypothetical protein
MTALACPCPSPCCDKFDLLMPNFEEFKTVLGISMAQLEGDFCGHFMMSK